MNEFNYLNSEGGQHNADLPLFAFLHFLKVKLIIKINSLNNNYLKYCHFSYNETYF